MMPCPKCEKPLDVLWEPTDGSVGQFDAISFSAECPACQWSGEVTYEMSFRGYWDPDEEDFLDI